MSKNVSSFQNSAHQDNPAAGRRDALLVAMFANTLHLRALFKVPAHITADLLVEHAAHGVQLGGESGQGRT